MGSGPFGFGILPGRGSKPSRTELSELVQDEASLQRLIIELETMKASRQRAEGMLEAIARDPGQPPPAEMQALMHEVKHTLEGAVDAALREARSFLVLVRARIKEEREP